MILTTIFAAPCVNKVQLKRVFALGGSMEYVIGIVIALICAILTFINLDEKIAEKIKILNIHKDEGEYLSKEIGKTKMHVYTCIIFCISAVVSIFIFRNAGDVLNVIKMNIALVCITGAAAMDYREHRIPNIYPLIMAVSGLVCLAVGYFTNQNGAQAYVFSSLIATVGVALCLTLAMVLTKQGIGLGDIKLLCALALVGGIYTICGTIFFAITFCAVLGVILLITKKKSLQSALPFAPFILVGYWITILASIY